MTYPRQRPNVETHLLPDGTCLLFDPEDSDGCVLNTAGALVWDYCDGTLTSAQIADELAALLPDHPAVREETEQVLQDLVERGLVIPSADAASPADVADGSDRS
jgi:hypothetical protein